MAIKQNDRALIVVRTGRITIFIGRGQVYTEQQVVGGTGRPLKLKFVDQDGTALDFSGDATGKVTMTKWKSGARIFDQKAMADGDNSGNFQYNYGSGELDEKGLFILEFKLKENGGTEFTVPEIIFLEVRPRYSST